MPRSPCSRPLTLGRLVPAGLAALLAAGALSTPARATTYLPVSDEHLVERAALIGTFEVVSTELAPTQRLATDYHLRLDRLLKGELRGAEREDLVVRIPGAVSRSEGLRFYGMPSFQPGESVLLFLAPRRDGAWGIAHAILGAFRTLERPEGALLVRPHLLEAQGLDRRGRPVPSDAGTARDHDRFVAWIADRAAGAGRPADYFVRADLRALAPRFTVFRYGATGHPLRWFDFDVGDSPVFHAQQDGAPPVGGGAAATVEAGLAAWSNVSQTNIRLLWGGTRPADLGFQDGDGFNMVLWEDPNDDIEEEFDCLEGGVLAIGGPYFVLQTLRFKNQDWHPIVEGQVILNAGITCYINGNSTRLAEIVAHELGHTLGFGHSCGDEEGPSCDGDPVLDEALMRASVHNDGRGAKLFADDIAAARSSYGTGGNSPRAPNKLSFELLGTDVHLSWNDRSGNEDGFRVYRRTGGGGPFAMIGETAAGASGFVDADLATGSYTYEVRSFNDFGESGASNRVTVVLEVFDPGTARFADVGFHGSEASGALEIVLERIDGSSGELSVRLRTQDLSAAAPFDYGARDLIVSWPSGDETPKIVTLAIVDDFTDEGTELVELLLETPAPPGGFGVSLGSAAAAIADDDGPGGCAPGESHLCLLDQRFKVEVEWRNHRNGARGPGRAIAGTNVSGYFWFFQQENVELIVKVIDGRLLTAAHWIFYGALSDVEYWVTVTDVETGERKLYRNAPGDICGVGDTAAFPEAAAVTTGGATPARSRLLAMGGLGESAAARLPAAPPSAAGNPSPRQTCVPGTDALCLLGGRFRVAVDWRNHRNGESGTGSAQPYSDQTGFFWFFDSSNIELVVKSLDGQGVNGDFWFFYGALSDVEYTITVTDTHTGAVHEYQNAGGNICGVGDISAFPGDG